MIPHASRLRRRAPSLRENSAAVKSLADHQGGPLLGSEDLQPGEGGLVRHGVNVIAVYRDEDGTPHRVSSKMFSRLVYGAFQLVGTLLGRSVSRLLTSTGTN
jgi:hypothetical protein